MVRPWQRLACACRGEDVVKAELLASHVVHVVGGDHGQTEVLGGLNEPGDEAGTFGGQLMD